MSGKTKLAICMGCSLVAVLIVVAVVGSKDGDAEAIARGAGFQVVDVQPEHPLVEARQNLDTEGASLFSDSKSMASTDPASRRVRWVSTRDLVERHEALPCTGLEEPTNFEVFSAGPAVDGLKMTDVVRRCDAAAPVDEAPANRITYVYGDCEITEGATGCAPPLEVQTWPACQRNKAEYSFGGEPLPSRDLPSRGGAEVVEFDFELERRIEIYTGSSTIVVFADDPELTWLAVEQLIPQEIGKPPGTSPASLEGEAPENLDAPSPKATEGTLRCRL